MRVVKYQDMTYENWGQMRKSRDPEWPGFDALKVGALLRIAEAQESQVARLNCIQNQLAGIFRELKAHHPKKPVPIRTRVKKILRDLKRRKR